MDDEAALEKRLASYESRVQSYEAKGRPEAADEVRAVVEEIKEQLAAARKQVKPHPALQFGPIQQTVASMSLISLGMSCVDLPYQMIPFYTLFSRLSVAALLSLVVYCSIIWYGYNQALKDHPSSKDEKPEDFFSAVKAKLSAKNPRKDEWANPRAHPSQFLTTRFAPPKIFPFPLGKSRPDASVKDELWWEGGNAPHVGHFNRPKLPEPGQGMEVTTQIIMQQWMEDKKIKAQRELWKGRIRSVQLLCVLVMLAYGELDHASSGGMLMPAVNRTMAGAGLASLIYRQVSQEIERLLDMGDGDSDEDMEEKLAMYMDKPFKADAGPKVKKPQDLAGGMSYIYDPDTAAGLGAVQKNSNIPIHMVPPHVLMTTDNHYYAGPGEDLKKMPK